MSSASKPSNVSFEVIQEIVEVGQAGRNMHNLLRRLGKTGEEIGEAFQAYLSVTSPKNAKGKLWEDVKEEAVDCLIMSVDVAATFSEIDSLAGAVKSNEIYSLMGDNFLVKLGYMQQYCGGMIVNVGYQELSTIHKQIELAHKMVTAAGAAAIEVCEDWESIQEIAKVKLAKWSAQIKQGTTLIDEAEVEDRSIKP